MILYLTSSPCVIGADRALLTEENHFLEQLRLDVLPSANCLYIASSPDAPDLNAHYSAEIAAAFAEAGLPFGELRILQSSNADQAARLVQWSNVIILAGDMYLLRMLSFVSCICGSCCVTIPVQSWGSVQGL